MIWCQPIVYADDNRIEVLTESLTSFFLKSCISKTESPTVVPNQKWLLALCKLRTPQSALIHVSISHCDMKVLNIARTKRLLQQCSLFLRFVCTTTELTDILRGAGVIQATIPSLNQLAEYQGRRTKLFSTFSNSGSMVLEFVSIKEIDWPSSLLIADDS